MENTFREHMNSTIKLIGDWKVSKLAQLFECFKKEIQESQLMDNRGALHERGSTNLSHMSSNKRGLNGLSIFKSLFSGILSHPPDVITETMLG